MLLHVPQRAQALDKMISSLKPGGWLVIEEFDRRLIERTSPSPGTPADLSFRRVIDAMFHLMDARGFDVEWPRSLYGRFKAAGLCDVGMEGHIDVREGGSPGAGLDAANIMQIRNEAVARKLASEVDIELALTSLADPGFRSVLTDHVHRMGTTAGHLVTPVTKSCRSTSGSKRQS